MKYLFSKKGLTTLRKFINKKTLLALDYDGTLTSIKKHPEDARLSKATQKNLIEINKSLRVALVSGRSLKDLKKLSNMRTLPMIGNHGLEFWNAPIGSLLLRLPVLSWCEQLNDLLKGYPWAWFEFKKYSLSIHYRQAKNQKTALFFLEKVIKDLKPLPHVILGKSVLNLLPSTKVDKGTATLKLMKALKCSQVIFVGDDVTDEYAFKLRGPRFLTVRVGKNAESKAEYFLKNQNEINQFIKILIRLNKKGRLLRGGPNNLKLMN